MLPPQESDGIMSILETIRTPEDVRRLPEERLPELAGELRKTILQTTAANGGHLASNLGMVEATIALHRVFSCPEDAFVFDVGHQAYAHKLLTGRYDRFSTLRQAGGVSGFTNRDESPYDVTTAGHSGPSIAAAVGMAKANARLGNDRWTVAIIGDGSFTGGMVYEALNQLDDKSMRLLILLNDNEMSISKNVGGVPKYLAYIRTSEGYFAFKIALKRLFSAIPILGNGLVRAARSVRDFLKRLTGAETLFESLGLEYIGPVNGNDVRRLSAVLEEAKSKDCPVLVHMITKKGLGYPPAEEHPERYHSTGPFPLTDSPEKSNNAEKPRTFTDEVSDVLCGLAQEDERIWAITAAMQDGCGLTKFAQTYPERFSDVGIAEELAVTMAGGLALGGMKPVLTLYSTFVQRTFDQLWHDVALQKADVLLLLSHCGLVPGDGVTHQGIYDVPLLSCIPGVTIDSPDDLPELRRTLHELRQAVGLRIVRYPKGVGADYGGADFADHGLWKDLQIGGESAALTVVTYGRIAGNVLRAAKTVSESRKTGVRILVLRRIFPLPRDRHFREALSGSEPKLFVEESLRTGGIGEKLAAAGLCGGKLHLHAIEEGFLPHGSLDYLMKITRMDEDSLEKIMGNLL